MAAQIGQIGRQIERNNENEDNVKHRPGGRCGEPADDGRALTEHRIEEAQQLFSDLIPGNDGRFDSQRTDANGFSAIDEGSNCLADVLDQVRRQVDEVGDLLIGSHPKRRETGNEGHGQHQVHESNDDATPNGRALVDKIDDRLQQVTQDGGDDQHANQCPEAADQQEQEDQHQDHHDHFGGAVPGRRILVGGRLRQHRFSLMQRHHKSYGTFYCVTRPESERDSYR